MRLECLAGPPDLAYVVASDDAVLFHPAFSPVFGLVLERDFINVHVSLQICPNSNNSTSREKRAFKNCESRVTYWRLVVLGISGRLGWGRTLGVLVQQAAGAGPALRSRTAAPRRWLLIGPSIGIPATGQHGRDE